MEERIEIEEVLLKKFCENPLGFTVEMEAGHTLTVTRCWKCGNAYFKVHSSRTGKEKNLRSLEAIARAIAGHSS